MPKGKNKGIHVKFREERNTWEVVEYINGQLKRHSTGHGDRESAQERLAEIIFAKGKPQISQSEVNIGQILSYYAKEHIPVVTNTDTALIIISHLSVFWGDKTLDDVKKSSSLDYIRHRERKFAEWQVAKNRKVIKKISQESLRRELGVLQAAINYVFKEGMINTNPYVWKPEKSPAKERWLTREEVAKLIKAARKSDKANDYLPMFILLGLYTGARSSALLTLQWNQVDFETGFIHFNRKQKSTYKRYSRVPMPRKLLRLLKAHRAKSHKDGYVINYQGLPIVSVKKSFATAYQRAGIEKITPHSLRHTAVSWMMQKGVPAAEIGHYVGMSPQMVERVYGHMAPEHLERARAAFG